MKYYLEAAPQKKKKEFITRLAIFHFIPLESKKEKERRKNKAFFLV
jgi:hypothetical protein